MDDKAIEALREKLDGVVGKRIDTICDSTLGNDHKMNQCAHFVSHMLNYDLEKSASCKNMTLKDKKDSGIVGATMRVNVVFNYLKSHQRCCLIDDDSTCLKPGLIYVTRESNIKKSGKMGTAPQKHIGVVLWPWVYHYSNTGDVVKKHDISFFMSTFTRAYGRNKYPVAFYRTDFLTDTLEGIQYA